MILLPHNLPTLGSKVLPATTDNISLHEAALFDKILVESTAKEIEIHLGIKSVKR